MSYIKYWTPGEWNPQEGQVYAKYFKSRTDKIKPFFKNIDNKEKSALANKLNKALEGVVDVDKLIGRIEEIDTTDLDKAISNLYDSYAGTDKSMDKYKQSAQNLLALRQLNEGASFSLGKDQIDILANEEHISELFQDDIKAGIGKIGEATSSIVGINIVNALIEELAQNNQEAKNIKIKYINTGDQRVQGTWGKANKLGVQRHTDNNLQVKFDLNGATIELDFNISDKGSKKLIDPHNSKEENFVYLRSSTIGNFIGVLNPEYVYNSISYHRVQGEEYELIQSLGALEALKEVLGHYLLYDYIKAERKDLNGNKINDAIDFTIRGSKIVPEYSTLSKLKSLSDQGKLKAQIGGFKNLRYNKSITSTELAEKYIDSMRVSLTTKI